MSISIAELADKVTFSFEEYCNYLKEQGPTSEERFQGLENPRDAVRKIKQETSRFAEQLTLEWDPVIGKDTRFAYLSCISVDRAYEAGRLIDKVGSDFLVAWYKNRIVGYAIVHDGEITLLEVSSEYRRNGSEGLCREVNIEGETFSVGVGHALVAECVSRYGKIRANTNSESGYICGSLGFDAVDEWTYAWN